MFRGFAWRMSVWIFVGLALLAGYSASRVSAAPQAKEALSRADVLELLDGGVPPKRVEILVKERGVAFDLTREAEAALRRAGATANLIETIRSMASGASGPAVLMIESRPGRAQVFVDDELIARTSAEGRLKISTIPAGSHVVRVSLEKYPDFEQTVEMQAGKTVTVSAMLDTPKLTPAVLQIDSTPGKAAVYVDDEFIARTSTEGRLKISTIPAGRHRVRVTADNYSDYDRTVDLVAGTTVSVSAILQPPSSSPGRKAGAVGTGKKDGLKYVWVPPGTYTMGCSPGDISCWDNENPAHQVTISKGYWMGQTEVTVDAYKRYTSAIGKEMPGAPEVGGIKKNDGWRYGTYPMVAVRWEEAVGYCTWAGGRLPTDAEWEYAARAGNTTSRYGALDEIAWSANNSGPNIIDSAKIGREAGDKYVERISALGNTFHPVGQKAANAWGLFDTIGSVWEWVSDWYDEKYFASSPGRDPQGPSTGTERVERGGSWLSTPAVVRLSRRDSLDHTSRWTDVGFRCALDEAGNAVTVGGTPESGGRKAGAEGTGKKDGLKYVWIPPGTFTMGCSPGDTDCWDNESPAHQVTLSKGFWMGQTEVTVEAYQRFVTAAGTEMPGEPEVGGIKKNPGWRHTDYPMVAVRWEEAAAYCKWAGGRLPTDAEWEYAARAGNTTARYGVMDDIAWSANNSGPNLIDSAKIGREAGDKYTERISALGNTFHPVGQKAANAWGLHDTIGSVWEWVSDWYDEKYFASSPGRDPQGPSTGTERVERGGSWLSTPAVVRLSRRDSLDHTSRWTDVGFRCALDQGGQ